MINEGVNVRFLKGHMMFFVPEVVVVFQTKLFDFRKRAFT